MILFSASFCKKSNIYKKDGKVFNEIIKGEKQEKNSLMKYLMFLHFLEEV